MCTFLAVTAGDCYCWHGGTLMLTVGTHVKLKLDAGCRHRHGAGADGRVGTIIAVVTEDVLTSVPAAEPRAFLTLDSFDGHLYSVELSEPGGLVIELCAASELAVLPR
jgi:hypothetical protein